MSEYYEIRHEKHDSPTKRLVNQKDATLKLKTANPDNKDKQLYTTDSNLKKVKNA